MNTLVGKIFEDRKNSERKVVVKDYQVSANDIEVVTIEFLDGCGKKAGTVENKFLKSFKKSWKETDEVIDDITEEVTKEVVEEPEQVEEVVADTEETDVVYIDRNNALSAVIGIIDDRFTTQSLENKNKKFKSLLVRLNNKPVIEIYFRKSNITAYCKKCVEDSVKTTYHGLPYKLNVDYKDYTVLKNVLEVFNELI